MMRRRLTGIGLAAALGLGLGGCLSAESTGAASSGPATPSTAPRTSSTTWKPSPPATSTTAAPSASPSAETSGLPSCDLGTLPAEVEDTVEAIEDGGPFIRRKDGSTFGNREGVLPRRPGGFYREYTVKTPGSNSAGARRIVTGGNPKTNPTWYFYTDDHYDTFCEITHD